MTRTKRYIALALTAAGLLAATGCAARVSGGQRYRDRDHGVYYRWDNQETVFYNQWVIETRRPPGREFRRLSRQEQQRYWNWRHERRR